jgi:hypothetical protein
MDAATFIAQQPVILADQQLLEAICMQHKIQPELFADAITVFFSTKAGIGEYENYKNNIDIKRNFTFWIPSFLTRKRNATKQQIGNKQAERNELRERNIKTLLDGEDYTIE